MDLVSNILALKREPVAICSYHWIGKQSMLPGFSLVVATAHSNFQKYTHCFQLGYSNGHVALCPVLAKGQAKVDAELVMKGAIQAI